MHIQVAARVALEKTVKVGVLLTAYVYPSDWCHVLIVENQCAKQQIPLFCMTSFQDFRKSFQYFTISRSYPPLTGHCIETGHGTPLDAHTHTQIYIHTCVHDVHVYLPVVYLKSFKEMVFMYSGDFWSLKWFWFLHLGESR